MLSIIPGKKPKQINSLPVVLGSDHLPHPKEPSSLYILAIKTIFFTLHLGWSLKNLREFAFDDLKNFLKVQSSLSYICHKVFLVDLGTASLRLLNS